MSLKSLSKKNTGTQGRPWTSYKTLVDERGIDVVNEIIRTRSAEMRTQRELPADHKVAYPQCLEFQAYSETSEVSTTHENKVSLMQTRKLDEDDDTTARAFTDLCDELEPLAAESEVLPTTAQLALSAPAAASMPPAITPAPAVTDDHEQMKKGR